MNRLYETEIQVDSIKQVNAANLSVLEGREPQFENMVQFFTENQFSLLKAIAKDSIVAKPTSGKFIKEHKLSGASSVKAALKILEDKELVYRTNEGYVIYDRFMDLWLKRIQIKKCALNVRNVLKKDTFRTFKAHFSPRKPYILQ